MERLSDEDLDVYAGADERQLSPDEVAMKRMAAELQYHRAMVKRLEEWAEELEVTDHPVRSTTDVAAELRNRMKGGQ